MWSPRSASRSCTALVLACVAGGCGGGDVQPPPTPSAIVVVSGSGQSGAAGQALAQPLRAKVTSEGGAGLENVTVTFAPTTTSGNVSPATATTDADGIASTIWTLGTAAGAEVDTVRASVEGVSAPAEFSATVTAASAATLELVAGNAQGGVTGQALADPLIVAAEDQYGNPGEGSPVAWAVTAGGGTVSAPSVAADAQGRSSVTWTLGPAAGEQEVAATLGSGSGAVVTFRATAAEPGSIVLSGVSPNPIVEGQSATLTGAGFSTTVASNRVTLDGTAATVVSATATSLTIAVPAFNCQPARSVPVQVKVEGKSSNVVDHPLNPSAFTAVAVGQQAILQDPANFCLQFPASGGPEDYLIGVQSTSEAVTSLTPASLTAVTGGSNVSAPLAELVSRSSSQAPLRLADPRRQALWRGHRAAEARLREFERRVLAPQSAEALHQSPAAASAVSALVPPTIEEGDVVPIRVPDLDVNTCTSFKAIDAVARVVGAKGVWLEDVANPTGGYTADDFQQFSDMLDDLVYDTDVDYFGVPSDLDGNGRIVVVITQEINKFSTPALGFVAAADLFPRDVCAASDEGEVYYGVTPDPSGMFNLGEYSRERGIRDTPTLISHEFAHIIQLSRRFVLNTHNPMASWTAEGQATLAEEVVGHLEEGRSSGQNYGFAVAFNTDAPASTDWYSDRFVDLVNYFGFETADSRVPGAPEECSWIARKPANPGPCLGGRDVYGTPWSLLRWVADQYGPTFPGGEKGLHRAIIDDAGVGYANITDVVGVPINTLLARWAAALYADDRVPGLDPALTLPSWNLFDIFDENLVEAARLVPRSRGFSNFSDAFNVRAGSAAYFRLSGDVRPATAVRVRNGSDGGLPAIMQVFVVRLR